MIGKSARMARFIRSSAALQWSSKVNWYFFLNLFNLSWWYIQCCIGCFPCFFKHGKSGDKDYLQRYSMSSHPLTPTTSDVPVTPSSTPGQSTKFSAVAESDSSFFGLTGNGASQSIALQFLWTMSSLMGRSKFDIQQRHNMAAIIIQRAWRRRRHAANNDSFDYGLHFEKSAYFDNNQSISSNIGGSCKDIANGSSTRLAIVRSIRQSFQPGGAMRRNSNENNASDAGGGGANRSRTRMTRNPSARASSATSSMIADTLNNRNESQVGSAMRELTGQRVAIGIIVALVMTVLFTYTESNTTRQSAMITLHTQTKYDNFADLSIDAARRTSIPDLFSYKMANGITRAYDVVENRKRPSDLRPREILTIRVADNDGTSTSTIGSFSVRSERREQALVALLSTFFIILIWFFGATSFAGPVMVLVVFPMERMVRLLAMLMVDPLGYQSSSRYRKFVDEEDEITRNTRWTKEVLKGMETSFL